MASNRARNLRKNLTDVERFVWARLRDRRFATFKFRRQVELGSYIVDFVCLSHRLFVELDGGQHTAQAEYDTARTEWLERQGFRVLRFWNHDVLADWDVIADVIHRALNESGAIASAAPSPPAPLPRGERGEMQT